MRVLFISSQYPPYELGGYEQLCQEAALELQRRGHDVRILTSRYGLKPGDALVSGNVDRSLHLTADIHYYRPLDFFLRRPGRERANLAALDRTLDEFKPDAVMFWGMFALSHELPYRAEGRLPGRVTYYLASYWPTDPDLHESYWSSPANRKLTEWVKRPLRAAALAGLRREGHPRSLRFEHAISCSEYVRDRLVEAGMLPAGSGVVHTGSDPEMFASEDLKQERRTNEALRLLYFGRLVPDKGVHTAIEALGLLKGEGLVERVKLTILGDGHPDYKQQLLDLVSSMGIGANVEFAGKVGREQIPSILQHHDVFLFTSIWPEPFGRTIIEAMMAGLVVIGSDVGGSREIFRSYNSSLLYPLGDASALADRIKRVLAEPELRCQLAEAGRRLAFERFTISHFTDQIESFLLKICGNGE